jgi:hypothetical protein
MKKLTFTLLALVAMCGVSMAQLTAINWVDWAGQDYSTPYDKLEIVAENMTIDVAGMDVDAFDALWADLDNSASIANYVSADGDLFSDNDPDMMAEFTVAWDDDNLYFIGKFTDNNEVAAAKGYEIAVQPVYYDMYIADSVAGTNQEYCRFNELGGSKTKFEDGVFTESVGTIGQTGGWGANANSSVTIPGNDHFYDMDDAGVTREIIVIDFASSMSYLEAPLAGTEYTAYAAALEDTIAFDVQAYVTDATPVTSKYFWSGDDNNSYTSLYYNGYIILGPEGVGVKNIKSSKSNINAYLANDELRISEVANVKVYNVNGQLVKSANNVSSLNMSNVAKGVYIVTLNNMFSTKVVK